MYIFLTLKFLKNFRKVHKNLFKINIKAINGKCAVQTYKFICE